MRRAAGNYARNFFRRILQPAQIGGGRFLADKDRECARAADPAHLQRHKDRPGVCQPQHRHHPREHRDPRLQAPEESPRKVRAFPKWKQGDGRDPGPGAEQEDLPRGPAHREVLGQQAPYLRQLVRVLRGRGLRNLRRAHLPAVS